MQLIKALEFRDDEERVHGLVPSLDRPTEVIYDEMVVLAKMNAEERDETRQRLGYKILVSRLRGMGVGGHLLHRQARQRRTI